jgi:undecaprenyl-diphosphatase
MLAYLVVWVQVLGEMLPISSSSQVELLLQWYLAGVVYAGEIIPKGFDYLLHVPILIVIPIFFRKSWWPLAVMICSRVWRQDRLSAWSTRQLVYIVGRVIGIIFVSAVFIAGVEVVVKHFGGLAQLRPFGLCITAILLVAAAISRFRFVRNWSTWHILFFVGLMQALAFVPGVSRMGVTATVALLCGLSVRRALEFSFALEYPLILAAVLVRGLPWLLSPEARGVVSPALIVHVVAAGVVSYAVLWFAVKIFERRLSWIFACYVAVCAVCLMMR